MEQGGDFMDDFEFQTFINCGQRFYVIDALKWERLKNDGSFKEVSFGSANLINIISNMVQFAENHSGFYCAITKSRIGNIKYFWLPLLFLETEIGPIRVRIETTTCQECGWQGIIANPTLPDLYDTVNDKFNEMNKTVQLRTKRCPVCNAKLGRHAIWIANNWQ